MVDNEISFFLKKNPIIGSIIGDIVGSIYEINDCKTKKEFPLFGRWNRFTDDSVMTLAVAKSLAKFDTMENLEKIVIENVVDIGQKYIKCGFGPGFLRWLNSDEHIPYGSNGNGAVMRISSIPVFFDDENDIKNVCKIVTGISHNHEESFKSSEAICMAIHLALKKRNKDEIKKYIEDNYYKLDKTVKELQDSKRKVIINSTDTAKVSLICFFESKDFEDAIRNAVSIGGDSDTISAITGGIAGAYYSIPSDIYENGLSYLDDYLKEILSNL